ncbi:MAG: transposase [Acidimicrobiales bacterium]
MFSGDLAADDALSLLDGWIARACRSRLAPFVKAAKTMCERRGQIKNALEAGISNECASYCASL